MIAVTLEVSYRRADEWPLWAAIPGVVLTFLIFKTVHSGPSLITAVAAFSLATILLRVTVSHFILGEAVVKGNLLAAAFMILAVGAGYLWR